MLSLTPRDTGMGWRVDCLECRFSEKGRGVLVNAVYASNVACGQSRPWGCLAQERCLVSFPLC